MGINDRIVEDGDSVMTKPVAKDNDSNAAALVKPPIATAPPAFACLTALTYRVRFIHMMEGCFVLLLPKSKSAGCDGIGGSV